MGQREGLKEGLWRDRERGAPARQRGGFGEIERDSGDIERGALAT